MPKIFISYRRSDGKDIVGRIADWLKLTYGDANVFTDVYNIVPGTDFRATLDAAIRLCDLVIAVIGPQWTGPTPGSDDLRIQSEGDWVRAELETATRNKIPIIPVLIGGASMPTANQLPFSLAHLRFLQAALVRPDPDFRTDIARLRDAISTTASSRPATPPAALVATPTATSPTPTVPPMQAPGARKQRRMGRLFAFSGALLAIIVVGVALLTHLRAPTTGASANNGGSHRTATSTSPVSSARKTQPYTAQPPGPNCDSNGAKWSDINGPGTCLSNGYVLSNVESIYFYWYPGFTFPANQQVSVTVTFNPSGGDYSEAGGICFEMYLRDSNTTNAKYDFGLCPDGSWVIYVPGGGAIKTGKVASAASYAVTASCVGSTLTYTINGQTAQVTDASVAAGGDEISLYNNIGLQITLSDFTFTPLS